ncbi:MAG TPA: peptidase, partial [Verrucomicrobiae bacterium]|nr:peptidase [Verrucomicrobiae bacterium]
MKEKLAIILWLTLAIARSSAQRTLPLATNLTHCYQKVTRDPRGLPGKAYWQNRADYDLSVDFDPASRLLTGTVGIDYTNNSPDTLKRLLFKLYPNLYQAQAMRSVVVAPEDLGKGMSISAIRIGGSILDSTHRRIKGTNMNLTGVTVLPHTKVHLDLAYSYTLNKGSFIRTGQIDTGSFFIAYFFPRIAVYDDLDGWNEYPYTGQYEFYNDYGDFRLAITLPASYLAWATGDLENADSIYA